VGQGQGVDGRNAVTVKVGSTTVVPARASCTSSWLLHPVTWNNGTDTRFRVEDPSARLTPMTRIAVSMLDRKFSWLVIAPLGDPVVPLV
jgi:hypothetical protein